MLSDLVQYFTRSNYEYDDCDYDLIAFLKFIHEYTCDDEILSSVEKSLTKDFDWFIDLFEYGFNEELYMNDIHLGDLLDEAYDNALVTLLLSTVTSAFSFKVYHEDMAIDMLLDNGQSMYRDNYRIRDFTPYDSNRKIDYFINNFIIKNMEDYVSDDDIIDDYSAEMEHFVVSYIKFKNKSVGRKIRKAYVKDDRVRYMFNELNYYMVNGELIFLAQYNAEMAGYNGFFDMDKIYFGLNAVRKDWFMNTSKNKMSLSLYRNIETLKQSMDDYCNAGGNHRNFFEDIFRVHACSRREVIL